MKKILFFVLIGGIIIIGFLFSQKLFKKEEKIFMPMPTEKISKKVALIVAFRDFRDEEYFIPKQILESFGIEVKTVSTNFGKAVGVSGGEAEVDLLLANFNVEDFDAVVFIGGAGAVKFMDDEKAHFVAKEALKKDKILAAICIAPTILAKAGVLAAKKATVWSSPLDKSAIKILKERGAIYQEDSVVKDGKIITANGPLAAKKFGEVLVESLK